MKVLSVNGYSDSGKTTVVEHIIRELRARGYTVGSVKQMHHAMDIEGKDTDRHRQAGASLVAGRGAADTTVLFQEKLSMDTLLSFYDYDYVILEGVEDIHAPRIITAHRTEDIDGKLDYRAFLISGVIANELREYKGYPVIDCMTDAKRMVDMIEARVPDRMPDMAPDCCGACGYDCHTLLERILAGKSKREDCACTQAGITLSIDGHSIPMVPFVQRVLKNAVLGVVKELRGYEKDARIEIEMPGQ